MRQSLLYALPLLLGAVSARPMEQVKREVPQERSHEKFLRQVTDLLNLNNPDEIVDAVFGLLGNAAGSEGAGLIEDQDCLQQATADQAFTNAKESDDVDGMVAALIFRALERNTGEVGLASVPCESLEAVNPEIAAIQQHQDPASENAAEINKAIVLELARQIALVGGDPQDALLSGTFEPGEIGDPTAAGNTCNDPEDAEGCIFTEDLLVPDASAEEIDEAAAEVLDVANGTLVNDTGVGNDSFVDDFDVANIDQFDIFGQDFADLVQLIQAQILAGIFNSQFDYNADGFLDEDDLLLFLQAQLLLNGFDFDDFGFKTKRQSGDIQIALNVQNIDSNDDLQLFLNVAQDQNNFFVEDRFDYDSNGFLDANDIALFLQAQLLQQSGFDFNGFDNQQDFNIVLNINSDSFSSQDDLNLFINVALDQNANFFDSRFDYDFDGLISSNDVLLFLQAQLLQNQFNGFNGFDNFAADDLYAAIQAAILSDVFDGALDFNGNGFNDDADLQLAIAINQRKVKRSFNDDELLFLLQAIVDQDDFFDDYDFNFDGINDGQDLAIFLNIGKKERSLAKRSFLTERGVSFDGIDEDDLLALLLAVSGDDYFEDFDFNFDGFNDDQDLAIFLNIDAKKRSIAKRGIDLGGFDEDELLALLLAVSGDDFFDQYDFNFDGVNDDEDLAIFLNIDVKKRDLGRRSFSNVGGFDEDVLALLLQGILFDDYFSDFDFNGNGFNDDEDLAIFLNIDVKKRDLQTRGFDFGDVDEDVLALLLQAIVSDDYFEDFDFNFDGFNNDDDLAIFLNIEAKRSVEKRSFGSFDNLGLDENILALLLQGILLEDSYFSDFDFNGNGFNDDEDLAIFLNIEVKRSDITKRSSFGFDDAELLLIVQAILDQDNFFEQYDFNFDGFNDDEDLAIFLNIDVKKLRA